MILKLEIIFTVVTYEKNIMFYKKHLKLTKNNTFNGVFCNRIFSYYRFLTTFQSDWISMNHGLFFWGKDSLQLYCF